MDNQSFIDAEPAPQKTTHEMRFHGSGSEYFRIWIVNTALTIVTIGLYWPWAMVRMRKYFYANTEVAGDRFQYDGPAKIIFRGYILVMLAFLCYSLANIFAPLILFIIILLFFIAWPWVFYKAVRFRARYSAYRGVRFKFDGTLGKSYTINMGYTALTFFLGIFFLPYVEYRKKDYVWNNLNLGSRKFEFKGQAGEFFIAYFKAVGLVLLGVIPLVIGIAIALAGGVQMEQSGSEDPNIAMLAGFAILIPAYIGILVLSAIAQQLIFCRITNYTLNNTTLPGIQLHSNINFWKLVGIHLSNLFLIIITLGLFTPWAQVRRSKYILEQLSVTTEGDALDTILSTEKTDEDAIGDAAGEIFDFEIGF